MVEQRQTAPRLLVGRRGPGLGKHRTAVADLDVELVPGATQPQPQGVTRVTHRVGEQFGGQQAGGVGQVLAVPVPQGTAQETAPLPHTHRLRGQQCGHGGERRRRDPGEQQGHVVRVVLGVGQQGGEYGVCGLFQTRGGTDGLFQRHGEGPELLLDVAGGGLHQAVGVEGQHRVRRHRQPGLLVGHLADAQRHADRDRESADPSGGVHLQHGQVSGGTDGQGALVRIENHVAAGDELVGHLADDRVQGAHQLPGRHTGLGQGV